MDHHDLAPTKVWDLDVPLVLGRADSGSDLPTFEGLLTPLQATPERGSPPLVATSPALMEDCCNKAKPICTSGVVLSWIFLLLSLRHQNKVLQPELVYMQAVPFLARADEFVPPFCSSLHPSIMPAHPPREFQDISALGSKDCALASPHLALTDAGARSSRFSSICSAECSTIRANLPMLMVNFYLIHCPSEISQMC